MMTMPAEIAPAAPVGGATVDDEVFVFPATAAQQRFWLLDQLAPGNSALNMTLALGLRGALDHDALDRALAALVDRHETLRTTFQYEGGELCQLVAPVLGLRVGRVDVRDFPVAERAGVPGHLADEEAARPFDLARGPLFRARVVCFSPVEHTLLLTVHHVVCDGWSLGVLLRDFASLYGAFVLGEPSPLPPLPLQFADYAEWQRDRAVAGGFDAGLAYWRERLAGSLPALDLPADRPPGASVRARVATAGTAWRTLPGPLATSLKTLAAREGMSAYMLHLTVFAALLSRYDANGGEDMLIGTPSANRPRAEVEGIAGLFANPLLLRIDLAGRPAFGELLARVRRSVLEAFEHAEVPFERVIETLESRRLQVNFQHAAAPLRPVRAGGLEMVPRDPPSGGAMYEWDATVAEDDRGVRVGIEYDAGLFDAATVERALADYEALLSAVAGPEGTTVDLRRVALSSPPGHTLRTPRWRLPAASGAWAESFLGSTDPDGGLRLVDRHGETAPVGVPGEIVARGSRTGDLGRRGADGSVEWLGRVDAQAHADGRRVDAAAVEAALRAHPHVREALVRGRTAWFQGDGAPAALVSPEQLRAFLRERLPESWLPTAFAAVKKFPLTPEGWLEEAHLPAAASSAAGGAGDGAPYLTIHFQLIDLWQELLGAPRVGIHDDFFALGGNSLLAMRMLARVEELSGKKLLPTTLFRQATVEGLADAILQQGGDGPPPELIAVQEKGARTPIFYLHGDMTGGGYYCMKLARQLGDEQPFYALPPAEIADWRELPDIPAMAARHIRAIRTARPNGPYIVGGFCLAGLISLEVARQLTAAGETVERLVLVDATARNRRSKGLRRAAERLGRLWGWDRARRLYHFCRWHFLLERLERWRKLDVGEQFGIVRRHGAGIVRRLRLAPEAEASPGPATNPASDLALRDRGGSAQDGSWFDPRWDVPLVFLWAEGGYEAGRFEGPATLLLSHDLAGPAASEPVEREWAKRLPRLETFPLAGSHLGSITEHVDGLAATLREALANGRPA